MRVADGYVLTIELVPLDGCWYVVLIQQDDRVIIPVASQEEGGQIVDALEHVFTNVFRREPTERDDRRRMN